MKKWCIALLSCITTLTHADDLTQTQKASIQQLIGYFKANDVKAISHAVQYPLKRQNPLPSIKNPQQMQQQFTQVFDATLRQKIVKSNFNDWQAMGWRGVMFDSGEIWVSNVDDEENPKMPTKITAVNYSGSQEQKLLQTTLAKQKAKLHPSIRDFAHPELLFKTSQYLIRIDQMHTLGQYRYVAWKNNSDQSKKPDLILKNGTVEQDGSGGNHHFTFKSGPYIYEVHRQIIGESDADASLYVTKNGQDVLSQEGYLAEY